MTLKLYAHPFSSYCQKVLVALYENGTPFEWRALSQENPLAMEELTALWPMKRFPVLVDADRAVVEASIIIEHLGLYHPGPVQLLPEDARGALEVRSMDRFFITTSRLRCRRSRATACGRKRNETREASPMHAQCSRPLTAGSMASWPGANGLREIASAWPIAVLRRSCFMRTGRIELTRRFRT